jgi:hypothetical protein
MRGVGATTVLTLGAVLMLWHWDSGARSLAGITRCAAAADDFHGGPFGQHGKRRRRVGRELIGRVNSFPADDGEHGFDGFDFFS